MVHNKSFLTRDVDIMRKEQYHIKKVDLFSIALFEWESEVYRNGMILHLLKPEVELFF